MTKNKTTVEVIDDATGKVVKELDVTGRSPKQIEKIVSGLEINLDHEHYHTNVHFHVTQRVPRVPTVNRVMKAKVRRVRR